MPAEPGTPNRHYHSVRDIRANVLTHSDSCFAEIVSGGVKLITFECSPSGKRMKPSRSISLIARVTWLVAAEPSGNFTSMPAISPNPLPSHARFSGNELSLTD